MKADKSDRQSALLSSKGQKMKIVVCLIAHGSRSQAGKDHWRSFAEKFRDECKLPYDVCWGFIEFNSPYYGDLLDDLSHKYDKIIAVPISLLRAGHVKNDFYVTMARLSESVREKVVFTPELGVHPYMIEALGHRIKGEDLTQSELILVGRGSSDKDANSDLLKISRLLAEKYQLEDIHVAFAGITTPSVETKLGQVALLRPKKVIVLPYLLHEGVIDQKIQNYVDQAAKDYPWIQWSKKPCLGTQPAIFKLIEERAKNALALNEDLACINCKYRTDHQESVTKVDGLSALLYSVRHQLTNSQAGPHEHAHKPMKKHILICTNTECSGRGSHKVLEKLRRMIRDHGLRREIKVTRTYCMGRCGEGPVAAVYPDGIWYRELEEADVGPFFDSHLLKDRLYSKRVDDIMH